MGKMNDPDTAKKLDLKDPINRYRDEFLIPERHGKPVIYLCGNSLGLQPQRTRGAVEKEMKVWSTLAVDGHFHSNEPWMDIHKRSKPTLAKLTGSLEHEVTPMNQLTNNLHFLLASFYRPRGKKVKILTEKGAFPSDLYALKSHIRFRGYRTDEVLIEVAPEEGAFLISNDKIINTIHQHADELAMVMMSGVQYYTGQYFDLDAITKAAHDVGAFAGFDLAHAIGNVPLKLHEWNVDFAAWCTYKYLNAGPGAVGGMYIHEKHGMNKSTPRLAGWWGQNESRRFLMEPEFDPVPGVDGWHQSNMNIISMAAHNAALELFEEAGFEKLLEKSRKLTTYLEDLLREIPQAKIITPDNVDERGCQLSLYIENNGKKLFDKLIEQNITVDWREPNLIRAAPVPLYNTFEEVHQFSTLLKAIS